LMGWWNFCLSWRFSFLSLLQEPWMLKKPLQN
jgi:hypothetical protein